MITFTSLVCGYGAAFIWLWPKLICPTNTPLSTVEDRCTIAPSIPLRILPLGDSITAGWGSRVGNGYRKDLEDRLRDDCPNREVDYIGSLRNGNWSNNEMEGWPGYTIESIANQTQPALFSSLSQKPNVVLLHAGTNDMADMHSLPYEEAPQRLGRLIDDVLNACGDATIIVAQIPQCNETGTQRSSRIPAFNAAVPGQVALRADKGFKVMLVDMSSIGVTDADLYVGLHPNEHGYSKMAFKWFAALQEASKKGWITPPAHLDGASSALKTRRKDRR